MARIRSIILNLPIFLIIALIVWLYLADFSTGQPMAYGVTFSQKYADQLTGDWRKSYLAILDDLGVKKLRLVAYWDLIELAPGKYNFTDLDWQLNQARVHGAEVVLAIGQRVPRWPECHPPLWVKSLSQEQSQERLLAYLVKIIERYKDNPAIKSWQVENEPFLESFGICPAFDTKFYKQELEFVRTYDDRPLTITESGELSTWFRAAYLGDYIGTSVYRITWNKFWGYFYYPLPPAYYHLKARLVKFYSPVKEIMISEMQMEPWLGKDFSLLNLNEQFRSMDLNKFKKNFNYAKRTGLSPIYFWGVEWWFWLKENGHPEIWQEALKYFKPAFSAQQP